MSMEKNIAFSFDILELQWKDVVSCMKTNGQAEFCINKFIPQRCKNALHRVTKVLRFSVDLFEYLLNERDNIKVVHLFRDPRAVINSRLETPWYKFPHDIASNARALCNKMLHDSIEGERLLLKYPSKFMFLYYEDLNDKAVDKVKTLYRHLGMSDSPQNMQRIQDLPVFSAKNSNGSERENNTALWWRKTLGWDIVQIVDTECAGVYKRLGFKHFKTEHELRDVRIPSLDIPRKYRLSTGT